MKTLSTIGFMIVLLFTAGTSLSEELAPQQDIHGVSYVNGGIGSEEVEALEAFKKQFDLYFLFSEGKAGRVVDDVNIQILDAKKQVVFSLEHAAPRLLLTLPSGKYQVIASYQGKTQRYALNHTAHKHQRVILNWKNVIDEDASEPVPDSRATAPEPAA